MFETIGNLITIIIWAVAIFLFGGGLFLCGMNLFTGNGWQKFWAVVAVILGVVAFTKLYTWLDSVVWCLLLTGIVLGVIGNLGSNEQQSAPQKEKKYGLGDALVDAYVEQEVIKEATKKAIRELENER